VHNGTTIEGAQNVRNFGAIAPEQYKHIISPHISGLHAGYNPHQIAATQAGTEVCIVCEPSQSGPKKGSQTVGRTIRRPVRTVYQLISGRALAAMVAPDKDCAGKLVLYPYFRQDEIGHARPQTGKPAAQIRTNPLYVLAASSHSIVLLRSTHPAAIGLQSTAFNLAGNWPV
jgi:hypothetical protein